METMAACRHTSAKADGSPLEFGECGLCVAASRSNRRWPRWQAEGVEDLSGYGGILDGGQNAHPRVASWTFQDIQRARAPSTGPTYNCAGADFALLRCF